MARDALVLSGSCVQLVGEAIAFAPLAGALRQLVQVTDANTLEEYVGFACNDLARLVPELFPERSSDSSDAGIDEPGCSMFPRRFSLPALFCMVRSPDDIVK